MNDKRRYVYDHVGELVSGDAERGYDDVELMIRNGFVENDHVQKMQNVQRKKSDHDEQMRAERNDNFGQVRIDDADRWNNHGDSKSDHCNWMSNHGNWRGIRDHSNNHGNSMRD